jgi:hypothetical protein
MNILKRIFKKKTLVANLPQGFTVLLLDPMVPLPKIPVLEKWAIIRQNCETAKMAERPDKVPSGDLQSESHHLPDDL